MTDLDETFARVCANEDVARYRDLEPELARVARRILDGWDPSPERLAGTPLRRAAYLIDALRTWMPRDRAILWQRRLDALHVPSAPESGRSGFWHRDRSSSGRDELANRWGLARGLELRRLLAMTDVIDD